MIDASVARSVGLGGSPQASRCRLFLEEVLRICHRLVATTDLALEWRAHGSPFAMQRLAAMAQAGKAGEARVEPDEHLRLDVSKAARNDGERQHMLDDAHLIEGALSFGSPVVSLDDRARNSFGEAARAVPALRNITWVNPCAERDTPVQWLENGALDEDDRRIGYGLRE